MTAPASGHDTHRLARLRQHLRRQLTYYLLHFVEGDHTWGQTRLTAAVVLGVLCVLISRPFETIEHQPVFNGVIAQLMLRELLPPRLISLLGLFASFFSIQALRHALPPLLGFVLALYFGAAYLRDLLELPTQLQAFKHLTSTLFGSGYPRMTISEGQAALSDPELNPMLKIGGPGWVDIKIGNAALFERVVGPSAVLGAGTHFVRRFETLREAFDLREVERSKNDVKLMTKDGLPIVMNEMRVRFRIRARQVRTEANPYPAMTGAIRRAAYNRKVGPNGLENWADMVTGACRGVITDWIARRRMDELIPPPRDGNQPEPPLATPYRQALHDLFQQKATRQRFADMGAEIIWVSVGHIRPDPDVDPDLRLEADPTGRDKIHHQLIETWKSAHAALAQDEIVDAKAYARWLADTARAEAESELILALTKGLREARQEGLPLDDVLADRLVDYVAGVPARPGDVGRLQRLLVTMGLLESGYPGDIAPPAAK
ncbi:MAG: SPFH domain-containing protein [Anaerolineales bacterium]|nr:SPFH domain-containing protein [Anaerolineales bacterium]